MRTLGVALLVALASILSGCGESQGSSDAQGATGAPGPDGAGEPAADAQGPDPSGLTLGQQIRATYEPLFQEVEAFLHDPELCVDGHWQLHFGDGQLFGPVFDLKQWRVTGETDHRDRALQALEANRALVEDAADNLLGAMNDLETVAMALLSLIEAGLYLDDTAVYLEAADALIEPLDELAMDLGDYLAIDVGEFAATTYGPTALTAFLALVHLEHAMAYPDADASHHIARGEAILEAVHATAWDTELAAFAFEPGEPKLFLYPSITVMLAQARAYALTGDPLHLDRYRAAHAGIQPLLDPDGDHYYSPYSAESMGALDEDYSTLSSQNYLMMALLAGYEATGDEALLEELDRIMGFVASNLLEDGRILHHWMNGMRAQPTDEYPYCLGCNLQSLYLLLLVGDATVSLPGETD